MGEGTRWGFVGVGTINQAIVRGVCRSPGREKFKSLVQFPVLLTPRNADKAKALLDEFGPELVRICESNEQVAELADVLVVGLTPQVTRAVMPAINARADQLVVNLVPAITNAEMESLCKAERVKSIKAVPLPPVAHQAGITIVCPPDARVQQLFDILGGSVPIDDEDQLKVMYAATAMMGPYYQHVLTTARWLKEHGIPDKQAATYAAGFHHCVSGDLVGKTSEKGLFGLVEEQTPGGLNEEAIRRMSEAGCYENQKRALDAIYARMLGKAPESQDGQPAEKKQRT